MISPLLANIYLHYVFDLWAARWRRREATGDMVIVRYADDIVVGFEHEADGRRFLDMMRERLAKFALTLHPEKTRLITFGRFAAAQRAKLGRGKPETFDFLGFTHICGRTRQGRFQMSQKSAGPAIGEAAGDQGRATPAHSAVHPRAGEMAEAGHHRLLCIPRRADQLSLAWRVP